jgi:hypothetical protein
VSKYDDIDAQEDPRHDAFSPGVSSEQRKRAEEMLGNHSFSLFVEQRVLDQQYRPGILIVADSPEPIEVMVSPLNDEELREYIILSRQSLRASTKAEIVTRQTNRETRLVGPLSPSRPGRRQEDQESNPPIQVARFYDTA